MKNNNNKIIIIIIITQYTDTPFLASKFFDFGCTFIMELEALLNSRPSLGELVRQVCLESEWYQIGVMLDLNPDKLSAIRYSAAKEDAKTSDM